MASAATRPVVCDSGTASSAAKNSSRGVSTVSARSAQHVGDQPTVIASGPPAHMGVTADRSYAVLGEGATRAIAYVAMSRGRQNNDAFIYQRISGEADHEHSKPAAWDEIHRLRRGNKYSAAHYFRMILAIDDQPRTIHTEAERTERHLLPDVVSDLLDRNEHDAACGVRYGANTPRRPAPGAGPGTPSGGRETRRTKAAAATSTGANSDPQFVRAVVQAHALPSVQTGQVALTPVSTTPVPPAPMLATIGVLPLDTSGYCFEAKWDGRWRVAISGLSCSAALPRPTHIRVSPPPQGCRPSAARRKGHGVDR